MRALTLTPLLPPEAVASIATLLVVLAGLAVMIDQRRFARLLFLGAVGVLLLPALDAYIDQLFAMMPDWMLYGLAILTVLMALHLVLSLFFGRYVADMTVAGLLVRGISALVGGVFRSFGMIIRAIFRI
jgi:hypothetical protein